METSMNVRGFTVIPVKSSKENKRVHYMYLKKLEPRHTVFVGNTPAWASKSDFRQAFQCCGKVEEVTLQHSPAPKEEPWEEDTATPASCKMWPREGYVTFREKGAVEKALSLPYNSPLILASGDTTAHSGLARYEELYLRTFEPCTRQFLTEKIAEYNRKEKEKEEAAKTPEPDEDGWVTVTRVGKNKGAPRTEAEDRRVKEKDGLKRKHKVSLNFYSFQRRESKKQRIEELQRQFREDRSAVAKIKKERRFRPF